MGAAAAALSSGDELAQEPSGPDSEDLEALADEISGLSGDELAQEKPKKEGPKPDGSGSDSGPDSEDLEALADDLSLASEDIEALLDGEELAQTSGPGPKDLPSDIDPEDLEDLADELSGDDLAQESDSGSDGPPS